MPFDGAEFSRAPAFQPLAGTPAGSRTSLWAWLRDRLPTRRVRSRSPEPFGDPLGEPPAVRLLRAARGLVEGEGNWVQGTYETPEGKRCAVGALRAAAARGTGWCGHEARKEAHRRLLAVARGRGFDAVETMNDRSTHAQVLAAFDAAIAGAGSFRLSAA